MAQIRDLLTTRNPLGPFRHDTIVKRSDNNSSSALIYNTAAFEDVFEEQRPLVVGRRGAGKTAVVSAMVAGMESGDRLQDVDSKRVNGKNLYVFINCWEHLDQLVDKVGLDARYSLGGDGDWSSLLAETASRHWARRIWMVIFEQIYERSLQDREIRGKLYKVVKYVEGRDILSVGQEISDRFLDEKFQETRGLVLEYLKNENKTCFVVIDSLDEYPVLAPRFQKLIAGLLKCVNEFNDDYQNLRMICCIPEEVEPFFVARASNHLKDLSSTSSVSRLRWRPIEL